MKIRVDFEALFLKLLSKEIDKKISVSKRKYEKIASRSREIHIG